MFGATTDSFCDKGFRIYLNPSHLRDFQLLDVASRQGIWIIVFIRLDLLSSPANKFHRPHLSIISQIIACVVLLSF